MRKRARQGFTLLEMLIVIAIIGVLVGVAIPVLGGQVNRAKLAVDQANVRTAQTAATTQYMIDGGVGTKVYYFDAAAGVVKSSSAGIKGYGVSNGSVDGVEDSIPAGMSYTQNGAGAGKDGSLQKFIAIQISTMSDGKTVVRMGWHKEGETVEPWGVY